MLTAAIQIRRADIPASEKKVGCCCITELEQWRITVSQRSALVFMRRPIGALAGRAAVARPLAAGASQQLCCFTSRRKAAGTHAIALGRQGAACIRWAAEARSYAATAERCSSDRAATASISPNTIIMHFSFPGSGRGKRLLKGALQERRNCTLLVLRGEDQLP